MTTVVMDKKDELIMKLVHYFITEENYNPIVVNGVKDEIWLENSEGPYRIIRINSNNIFNEEQLNFDNYKIRSIVKQIKKKTFSFKVNTLNILLNVNEDLKIEEEKNITPVPIFNNDMNITNKDILEAFPDINEKLLRDNDGVELILNVTKDINEKTDKENKIYEKAFKPKKIIITPIIMIICLIMFVIPIFMDGPKSILSVKIYTNLLLGANIADLVKVGQVWRLVTSMFLHWSLIHFLVNMYSLRIIGTQIENFLGKVKYIAIYLVSGICGALLSCVINPNVVSVGASGAIFGLLGALLYFGYHYRNYLGVALKTQIIPIIILNLAIGFIPGSSIDNACHIGGLVGGFLCAMALGVSEKSKTSEKVNGTICLLILLGFLSYLVFFR